MSTRPIAFKFVTWDIRPLETYKDTFAYEDITVSPPPPVIESIPEPEPEPYYGDYEAYELIYVETVFEEEESGVGNVLDDY